jgi:hypothetical protein
MNKPCSPRGPRQPGASDGDGGTVWQGAAWHRETQSQSNTSHGLHVEGESLFVDDYMEYYGLRPRMRPGSRQAACGEAARAAAPGPALAGAGPGNAQAVMYAAGGPSSVTHHGASDQAVTETVVVAARQSLSASCQLDNPLAAGPASVQVQMDS